MSWSFGNSPVYDKDGVRVGLREVWRRPSWPMRAPECEYHGKMKRIGWNLYRCSKGCGRSEPERLYHRLMLWWNPFLLPTERPWRRLVRVVRWAPWPEP